MVASCGSSCPPGHAEAIVPGSGAARGVIRGRESDDLDRARPPAASERGQGIVEYGLILGLIAVVAVVALMFFGDALATALSLLGQAIDPAH